MAGITRINVAIIGAAGVGKSMALNALAANPFAQCLKGRRTTLHPHIYTETPIKNSDLLSSNVYFDSTSSPAEYEGIRRVEYTIPKLIGLSPLRDNMVLSIHDLPALDDSATKNIYHKYAANNFHEYDIILFITNINSCLISTRETEIIELIASGIKTNKKLNIDTKLFILFNKCDDTIVINKTRMPRADNLRTVYNDGMKSINSILNNTINKAGRVFNYKTYNISFEDAFIYRMIQSRRANMLSDDYINKIGYIEYGMREWNMLNRYEKLDTLSNFAPEKIQMGLIESGFNDFIDGFNASLSLENQHQYAMNRIYYDMKSAITERSDSLELNISPNIRLIRHNINQLHNIFGAGCPAELEEYSIKNTALKALNEKISTFMEFHMSFVEKELPSTKDIRKLLLYKNRLGLISDIAGKFSKPLLRLVDESISKLYLDIIKDKNSTLVQLLDAVSGIKECNIDGYDEIKDMINNIEKYEFFINDINNYTETTYPETFITDIYNLVTRADISADCRCITFARLALYDLQFKLRYIKLYNNKNEKAIRLCREIMDDILFIENHEKYLLENPAQSKYYFLFRHFKQVAFPDEIIMDTIREPIKIGKDTFLSLLLADIVKCYM